MWAFIALLSLVRPLLAAGDAQTIAAEKETRTAAMQKMDSQLVLAVRKSNGETLPEGARLAVRADASGRVTVDITSEVTPDLLAKVEQLGGAVLSQFPGQHAIRAAIPVSSLERLASEGAVRFLRPAVPALREGAHNGSPAKP